MSVAEKLARISSGVRRNGTYELGPNILVWTVEIRLCRCCGTTMRLYKETTENCLLWWCCSRCSFNYLATWRDTSPTTDTLCHEHLAYLEAVKAQCASR